MPANTPAESVRPLNWTYGTSTATEATIGLAPEAGWVGDASRGVVGRRGAVGKRFRHATRERTGLGDACTGWLVTVRARGAAAARDLDGGAGIASWVCAREAAAWRVARARAARVGAGRRQVEGGGPPPAVTVKAEALVPVPKLDVTAIGPVDAPAGTAAVIWVSVSMAYGAAIPLNLTDVAALKCEPVIVTLVPGFPLGGESPDTTGGLASLASAALV